MCTVRVELLFDIKVTTLSICLVRSIISYLDKTYALPETLILLYFNVKESVNYSADATLALPDCQITIVLLPLLIDQSSS